MHEEPKRTLRLVTALLEHEGRFLITQRRAQGQLAGLWEFPGDAVRPGETDETALKRVFRDRLGVDVVVGSLKAFRTQEHLGHVLEVVLHETSLRPGEVPRAVAVARFHWVAAWELERYPFVAADQLVAHLVFGQERKAASRAPPAEVAAREPAPLGGTAA
jgi:8-oxo-dGTP diphosphatase